MRILVFGAGAMGSFFGALLSVRHQVTLVGREPHMRAIRAHGLRVTGKTAVVAHPNVATTVPRTAKADLVLVTTKAYDTAGAMRQLRPLAKGALFLTLQNGLDNPEVIARTARRVAAGTTSHGVTFLGPGAVRHAGVGDTTLGPWRGVTMEEAIHLRDIFADAGVRTRVTEDVATALWAKAVVNAAINPLAALAGVSNGTLVKDRRMAAVLDAIGREAVAVARADGAMIDPEEVLHRTVLVARRTASNRASMLQDLDRGRRTEIDAITGALLAAADRHGIKVPLNRALYALVRARETARSGGVDA